VFASSTFENLSFPLTQADIGGGAWRVKWHPLPARKNDLLVACMYDGFKILRFNVDGLPDYRGKGISDDWNVIKRYDAHDSLAYGVDWSFATDHGTSNIETLIASGSFYDHALHLWSG
jgi:diphthamide biosynthesis protein 7